MHVVVGGFARERTNSPGVESFTGPMFSPILNDPMSRVRGFPHFFL